MQRLLGATRRLRKQTPGTRKELFRAEKGSGGPRQEAGRKLFEGGRCGGGTQLKEEERGSARTIIALRERGGGLNGHRQVNGQDG